MVVPWDGNITRNGLQNNVDASIVHVCRTLILRAAIPKWMYKLPISRSVQLIWFQSLCAATDLARKIVSLKKLEAAFDELQRFMDAEITAKQDELAKEAQSERGTTAATRNLFARVVLASQEEGATGTGLTHDEIRGNLFIYLLAGVSSATFYTKATFDISIQHETTAGTLVVTLALLAMHQDEQERIHEFIRSILGDREPVRFQLSR